MSKEHELPLGWILAKLGDFTTIIGGSTPSRDEARYFGGGIIWLTPTEIPKETVTIIAKSRDTLTEEGVKNSSVRLIPTGSVLLTSRASIGYVAIAGVPLTTNQGFASFVLSHGLNPLYVGWWLRSQKKSLEDLAGGTTFKEISKTTLKDVQVPLAPLLEQQRIVEALEQQLSRLDAGVVALRSTQQKLKRYRAAVLKAAVEGKLTEEWRKSHPELEPASELLKRILVERRAKWEEERRAKGRDPQKVKYIEPAGPDVRGLPELPQGWCWVTVEQFADTGTGATPLKDREEYYESGTIPWVTSGALNQNTIVSTNEFITEKALAETNVKIFPIGTLLVAMYGEGKTRGKVSELKIEATTNQACAALVFYSASSKYCQPYMKYFLMKNYFDIRKISSGGVQPNLNLQKIKGIIFPLPPLAEQEQIVSLVEERLSIVSTLESTIKQTLKRAERMRQSILHRAFTGQLVPQDPNDESASVLLERIRWEREQAIPPQKRERPTLKPRISSPSRRVAEDAPQYQEKSTESSEVVDAETTTQGTLWGDMEFSGSGKSSL